MNKTLLFFVCFLITDVLFAQNKQSYMLTGNKDNELFVQIQSSPNIQHIYVLGQIGGDLDIFSLSAIMLDIEELKKAKEIKGYYLTQIEKETGNTLWTKLFFNEQENSYPQINEIILLNDSLIVAVGNTSVQCNNYRSCKPYLEVVNYRGEMLSNVVLEEKGTIKDAEPAADGELALLINSFTTTGCLFNLTTQKISKRFEKPSLEEGYLGMALARSDKDFFIIYQKNEKEDDNNKKAYLCQYSEQSELLNIRSVTLDKKQKINSITISPDNYKIAVTFRNKGYYYNLSKLDVFDLVTLKKIYEEPGEILVGTYASYWQGNSVLRTVGSYSSKNPIATGIEIRDYHFDDKNKMSNIVRKLLKCDGSGFSDVEVSNTNFCPGMSLGLDYYIDDKNGNSNFFVVGVAFTYSGYNMDNYFNYRNGVLIKSDKNLKFDFFTDELNAEYNFRRKEQLESIKKYRSESTLNTLGAVANAIGESANKSAIQLSGVNSKAALVLTSISASTKLTAYYIDPEKYPYTFDKPNTTSLAADGSDNGTPGNSGTSLTGPCPGQEEYNNNLEQEAKALGLGNNPCTHLSNGIKSVDYILQNCLDYINATERQKLEQLKQVYMSQRQGYGCN